MIKFVDYLCLNTKFSFYQYLIFFYFFVMFLLVFFLNSKLFLLLFFLQSCKAEYTFICIYNADFVDQYSWTVFLRLAEKEKVLILFSLSVDFKEAEKSSSIILLKSFKNINTDPIQEDIFAPALCWNLHVKAVHTTLFV